MFEEGAIDIVDGNLLLHLSELEEGVVADVGFYVLFYVIGGHFHETYDTAGNDGPFPADHRYRSPSVVG